jgi:hypothetical protein
VKPITAAGANRYEKTFHREMPRPNVMLITSDLRASHNYVIPNGIECLPSVLQSACILAG